MLFDSVMKKVVSILLSLSLVSAAADQDKTQSKLPEFEPTRYWQGTSYANAMVEHFRRHNQNMKVTIDLSDLRIFTNPEDRKYDFEEVKEEIKIEREKLKKVKTPVQDQAIALGRKVLPKSITNLTWSLENGEPIYLNEPIAETQVKEDALTEWILKQGDHSIEPHVLMSKALELSGGKLMSAWSVAWNVLRKDWAAAAVRNYGSVTKKMVSVTGERKLWQSAAHLEVLSPEARSAGDVTITRGDEKEEVKGQERFLRLTITKRGDDFSYLYHRIGVELLAMVTAEYTGNKWFGGLLAKSGAIAEWAKFTKTAGIEPERKKRVVNDITAGTSGMLIYDLFKSGKKTRYSNQVNFPTMSGEMYLQKNGLLYGGSYLLDKDRPSIYEGSKIDSKYWDNNASIEELKYRFHYGTRYDSDALNIVLMLANGDYELLHRGLVAYMNSSQNDPELNKYLQDHLSGVKAEPKIKDISVDLSLGDEVNIDFMKQAWDGYDLDRAREYWHRMVQRVLVTKLNSENKCLRFYR